MKRQAQTEIAPTEQTEQHNKLRSGISRRSRLTRRLIFIAASVAFIVTIGASSAAAQEDSVSIELSVNGDDADSSPGPVLAPGSPIEWTYTVTVNGASSLYDFIVTDTSGTNPDCDIDGDGTLDGFNHHPGPLVGGDSFVCKTTGVAAAPASVPYQTTGSVKAVDSAATQVFEASDPAYYSSFEPFTPEPAITIESAADDGDPSGPESALPEGQPAPWKFIIRNTGNVALANVTLTDNFGSTANCGDGTNVVAGPVAPGVSITCTGTVNALAFTSGETTGLSTVVATPIDPTTGQPLAQITATEATALTTPTTPNELAFTGVTAELLAALALSMVIVGSAMLAWPANRRSLNAS